MMRTPEQHGFESALNLQILKQFPLASTEGTLALSEKTPSAFYVLDNYKNVWSWQWAFHSFCLHVCCMWVRTCHSKYVLFRRQALSGIFHRLSLCLRQDVLVTFLFLWKTALTKHLQAEKENAYMCL